MQAIYISSNQFKVSTDKTSEFLQGRRVRALCGSEYKYSTVYSSVYSSPDTTVTIEENVLTSNLSSVHYGIVNIGEQGSFPNHLHDGSEGAGGELSLLTLSDTPSVYEDGEYLRSTTSGVEWTIPEAEAAVIRVKEENVSAITKGQVCAIVGSSGVMAEVGLCDCDDADKIRNIGIAQTNMVQNEDGIIVYKGIITGVDTRTTNTDINPNGETWVAGELLWVSTVPGGMTNIRPTSGRSIKAARTIKGNSNSDVLIAISHENTIWSTAAVDEDVVLRMGDSAGVNKVSIREYTNDEVAAFDSYGNLTLSGTVDGVNIDEFKSSYDTHEHDDRYYTEAEVDTISGSLQSDIDDKSDIGHLHDDRYYTESEVDTISGTLQINIDDKVVWHLIDGVPSEGVGKKDDVAIGQEAGIIYKRSIGALPTITWDPEDTSAGIILSNGNLTATNGSSTWRGTRGTAGRSSGKWYFELTINDGNGDQLRLGVAPKSEALSGLGGGTGYSYRGGGQKGHNNSWTGYGASYTVGDIISVALDMDNGKLWWAKNGVWQSSGNPGAGTNEAYSGVSGTIYPQISIWGTIDEIVANFGASAFSYTVPTGFSAWSYISNVWQERLIPDFLKLSDTPTTYSGTDGYYLKTTISGIEFSDDNLYTKSEVDTISGTLQTDIDGKPDTEWFLTEGFPSGGIGKKDDVAIDQETGVIYERFLEDDEGYSGGDFTFYPAVSGDDGYNSAYFGWNTTNTMLILGSQSGSSDLFIRFPNVTIPNGTVITQAYVRMTSYDNQTGETCSVNCYFNDVDNAVAPTNNSELNALSLTSAVAWSAIPAWTYNSQYDTPSLVTILQSIIDRTGWSSGNAVQLVIKDNGSAAFRHPYSFNYVSGTKKAELHISCAASDAWDEKLSPDFLKLSDTPTTYSGSEGKYLKTTNSGIEFVDNLYTKSEVDTISGTLQTDIDSMPVTLLELEDTPTTYSGSVGKYLKTTSSGIIFSDIDSEYWESVDVFLDENYSNEKGLPTQVERGLFKGYSMPIWSTPANQYEELVFRIRVPFRWDDVTNPTFMMLVSISATEDVGDKFKFQMEWESKGVSNVIPDTTAETLTDEITVTDGTAYYSYLAAASLDATKLTSGENLQFRVRRIAAASPQVSNEIIIWHWDSRWKMNKLGTDTE